MPCLPKSPKPPARYLDMYYMISIYKGGWLYVMYVGVLYYVPKLGCSLVSAIKIFFLFLCWVGEYWVIGGLV